MSNSNKEEFNKQDNAEGKLMWRLWQEMWKLFENLQDLHRSGKQAAEKWHQQFIAFKENLVEKLQKAEGKNKRFSKDINEMRTVNNTSAPSLGEEGTKTIWYLKKQMVLMEEENIKLFNEKKYFLEDSKKAFQNNKDWEVVFQITIADLKQIILKNDKEKTNSDGNKQLPTY